jgi:hypothetical protein
MFTYLLVSAKFLKRRVREKFKGHIYKLLISIKKILLCTKIG